MLALYWRKFVLPYRSLVSTAIFCFIIASVAGLAAPIIIKILIDGALAKGDMSYLSTITGGIVVLYFIRGIFFYIYGLTMAKAGNESLSKMRQSMFDKLQSLDYAYFVNMPAGEIISLFTNDLWLIQQAVTLGIPDLLVESLNLLATMLIMIYFDWQLALVTFITLPFIIAAIAFFNKRIALMGTLVEHTLAKLTGILHQSLLSVRVVQSYVREDYEYQKFSLKIYQVAGDYLKVQRLNAILVPLVEFLAALGLTIIIWFGGREVINGSLSIGGMFAFLVYIINVPAPVRKISQAISMMKLGTVAWQRIGSLRQQSSMIQEGDKELKQVTGKVEFKNVSFSYSPDLGILKDINIAANPGDIIAIVGPSGAGKSSFANLLLRFYDPTGGSIYLDDVDIRTYTTQSVRKYMGFIQQDPILFNATIFENIRYGRPSASYSQVERVAKLANAHDFIMELPKGYNSVIGELGSNLSGGQRQRLAIARAIIMEPSILILDEPTASLDAHAEKQVMEAIRNASVGRTTFIITHRLSTLNAADTIVYLDHGRIVEMGTHTELLAKDGYYAKAVQLQELHV
ncbi:abc transporter [Lucifera butyrica]|uniref:Abc transporter n=1 Tax=Lucifera butyrica TaxID=1351585 RepID=A0A498R9I7_9FIRM|nr:ABC transporter ATP-binding protein [Lucifera butyrica]VBB06803.1 abc transporter [Lucifera butyrica]